MENLLIEGDVKSPTLDFNAKTGVLVISGRSLPEHPLNVYEPAFAWLEDYKKSPQKETTVSVSLEYFNTSSSKVILDIFKKLEELHNGGNTVKVLWHYEEDDFDLKEEGETYGELLNMPVEMIGIEEFDFQFI